MKTNNQFMTVVGMAAIAGLLLTPVDGDARGQGQGRGQTTMGQQMGLSSIIAGLPMQDLSAEEELGLNKMREEEKLARDVYHAMYKKWNHVVFANISRSEQKHMDMVKLLLDKYDRPDPVDGLGIGEFSDPEMQTLHDSLVARGEESLIDALTVGATIEDLDIKDLYDLLAQTDNSDIKTVYQNLVKGSRNHLRSFVSLLAYQNILYDAQYLSQTQVDDIITSPRERGRVDENGDQISGMQQNGSGQMRGKGRGSGRWH